MSRLSELTSNFERCCFLRIGFWVAFTWIMFRANMASCYLGDILFCFLFLSSWFCSTFWAMLMTYWSMTPSNTWLWKIMSSLSYAYYTELFPGLNIFLKVYGGSIFLAACFSFGEFPWLFMILNFSTLLGLFNLRAGFDIDPVISIEISY